MKILNELRQFYPLDELLKAAEIPAQNVLLPSKGSLASLIKMADVKKRIGEIYHERKVVTDTEG
ncbi:hypothetical protein ACNKHO_22590 [Shigella flexneri]